jgi:CheY-like chemotaxis protein
MPNGGPLTIRTREVSLAADRSSGLFAITKGDYLLLEVEDHGTGMDDKTRRRIFEPFFTTKGETNGTGLGLSTCYGIVLQAGGAIFVDTEVGRGTTFQVYLPRCRRGVEATDAATPAPQTVPSGHGETILVVEDEASVRQVTLRALQLAGYRVFEATNLSEAVALTSVEKRPIDLLLTDLVLPDGNGGEVAQAITRLRPGIRVLYVSGHTDDAGLRRGISESKIEFLSKPFTPGRLVARVREVLDRPAPPRPRED